MHNYRTNVLIILLVIACSVSPSWATEEMLEFDLPGYTMGLHPWLSVDLHDQTHQAAYQASQVLPQNITAIDVLEIEFPKSNKTACLVIARSEAGMMPGGIATYLAFVSESGSAQLIKLNDYGLGAINRVCFWPDAKKESANIICLVSSVGSEQDADVYSFQFNLVGSLKTHSTSGASTVLGWFDVRDLDDDGDYELITSRNLDGMWGGFFYHAVRELDLSTGKYLANPQNYMEYFKEELTWLDWVVETKRLIQADPTPYLNSSGMGHNYVATYHGKKYGFDSIIELPRTFNGGIDVDRFNQQRRDAFKLVQNYRDELRRWIDGGELPSSWMLR